KIVTQKQTREKIELYEELKEIISEKQLKACFQPLCRLTDGGIMGYEALIRGPQGSALERPDALFAVSHQNDMDVELESLGLETILYLRPAYIKVADSLVRNLEADPIKREIITSLAAIGRRVNATVIAEGIEREEEHRALVDLDIEYGQGYLLGRPSFQVPP